MHYRYYTRTFVKVKLSPVIITSAYFRAGTAAHVAKALLFLSILLNRKFRMDKNFQCAQTSRRPRVRRALTPL